MVKAKEDMGEVMVFKPKAKSQIIPQIIPLQCLTQFYTICNSYFATLTFTMCFTWKKKIKLG
jgi:hypothetical protein